MKSISKLRLLYLLIAALFILPFLYFVIVATLLRFSEPEFRKGELQFEPKSILVRLVGYENSERETTILLDVKHGKVLEGSYFVSKPDSSPTSSTLLFDEKTIYSLTEGMVAKIPLDPALSIEGAMALPNSELLLLAASADDATSYNQIFNTAENPGVRFALLLVNSKTGEIVDLAGSMNSEMLSATDEVSIYVPALGNDGNTACNCFIIENSFLTLKYGLEANTFTILEERQLPLVWSMAEKNHSVYIDRMEEEALSNLTNFAESFFHAYYLAVPMQLDMPWNYSVSAVRVGSREIRVESPSVGREKIRLYSADGKAQKELYSWFSVHGLHGARVYDYDENNVLIFLDGVLYLMDTEGNTKEVLDLVKAGYDISYGFQLDVTVQ